MAPKLQIHNSTIWIRQVSNRLLVLFACYSFVVFAWWVLHQVFVQTRGPELAGFVMPGPFATLNELWSIVSNGDGAKHVGTTFLRTVIGTLLAAGFGILIVVFARFFGPFRELFRAVIYPGLRALPSLSIALLAVVWFGLGSLGVVFVVVIAVLPIYLTDLWEGLKVMDGSLIQMAQSITTKNRKIFSKLILPMLIPRAFSASKLGFSVALKLTLVGEVFAATNGIGYELYRNLQESNTQAVYAWTLIVITIVVVFDYCVFDIFERKYLFRWKSL